jgi:modulator of FtsH protease
MIKNQSGIEYLRQVYVLLTISLLLTVVSGYFGLFFPVIGENTLISIIAFFGSFALIFFMKNIPSLMLFSSVNGFFLSPLILHYLNNQMGYIVFEAIGLTLLISIGLTIYAFLSKRDFSVLGTFLTVSLIVVIVATIINIFLKSAIFDLVLSCVSAIIFSFFLIKDTQELKNNPWSIPPVFAVLGLYLDIINLFLDLLRILASLKSDD